ncbi:MAG: AAA family ATPase [Clostridia bacterium]|nr:AAA family ATPase [Clostridia bacterium]
MINQSKNIVEKHVKTHTERAAEDVAAVNTLSSFLDSDGRINCDFSKNDKWPNIDGTFEFVPNPDLNRRPSQNFFVQIKGTHNYTETNNEIKYSLRSLAFPAFIASDVTLDPGILFVVLNPDDRETKRVFWKYISVDFINSIDFTKESATITFSADEELFNSDDSITIFCKKLESIISRHSFVSKLSDRELCKVEIDRIIKACDQYITKCIDLLDSPDFTRDDISHMILPRLYDLCRAALLLNSLKLGSTHTNLQLAWEQAMLKIETKYLATFLRGLKYIEDKEPDDGQSERLMLKYYNFLWQIRDFLNKEYEISILHNLEKIPLNTDKLDDKYYELIANAINSVNITPQNLSGSRFNIIKKVPFFVGKERYYEITLQLAGVYATKYNRITAYTKENLTTNYSVQIAYIETEINLWGIDSKIKVITNWSVSIEPASLNKLAKILKIQTRISANYNEYSALMAFLTQSGISLLDLIDLKEVSFYKIIDLIYNGLSKSHFKDVLLVLQSLYSKGSTEFGRNTVRYLLINLREETLENVLPWHGAKKTLTPNLYLSTKCYPFEKNPFISNLFGSNTSNENNFSNIINAVEESDLNIVRPYLKIQNKINRTGEIFFDITTIASQEEIDNYNAHLDNWERYNGYKINVSKGLVSIDSYEKTTITILKKLSELSKIGNKGQKEFNQAYLKNCGIVFEDELKRVALQNVFVNSHILLIYGAAGTGKTLLINYISNLMSDQKKLFLTKTHTAKQNLQRRIDNPGADSDFVSIDSFKKRVNLPDYDIIFVDECSTIDNRTMCEFLGKISPNTFLVLAGDIHQIESIDFGNWFFYAKELINTHGSNVELLNTWRTQDAEIISLWDEVRCKEGLITEKLAIDGPFSDNIGEQIFAEKEDDEVVLCLNYDGKFGLNNMNNYFQNNNSSGDAIVWQEWTYKVGDHILFNDSSRFTVLYNNLKGTIVEIDKSDGKISFTIDVDTNLTEARCEKDGIEFISAQEDSTRIRFSVFAYKETDNEDENENARKLSVIPFQLGYAVSIHKAQGLEYDSVKVIIPKSNAEKITHGIFYTAITRAKKKLKIYWSTEIMTDIVKNFEAEENEQRSLSIIRNKLISED